MPFDIAANHDDRIVINHRAGELTLNFGGDNVQANNFEKLVPAFALKRRFADSVTIDLNAVEQIYVYNLRLPLSAPGDRQGLDGESPSR